jgi:hypothetical protein
MSWLSLFNRVRTPRTPKAPVRRRGPRPGIELLEDRCVPAVFTVNSTLDTLAPPPGVMTLRSAIQAANQTPGGNTINLAVPGDYRITLPGANTGTNNSGAFVILPSGGDLTINNTSGGTVVLDGNNLDRVLDINPAFDPANPTPKFLVTIQGVTITGGRAFDPAGANPDGGVASGGGIRAIGNASVTLLNDILTNNSATADGGGIVSENAVSVPWTFTITNTVISNNHAGDAGGGIDVDGTGKVFVNNSTITGNSSVNQGAGIWLDAVQVGTVFGTANLTVTGSTISNNTAIAADNVGGGIGNAGNGTVTIQSSTLANNFSGGVGGGFGDENAQGTLVVLDSTFVGNTSIGNGGGISAGGVSTTINDSTINGNTSIAQGGGVSVQSPNFMLNNTIVALNFANGGNMNFLGAAPDVMAAITTGSGDFIGVSDANLTGLTNGINANQVGTTANPLNPRLGPLQNNGGPTQTEAPLPGSPVLDAGINTALPAGTATDQRGFLRVVNARIDIGAEEFQPPATMTTLAVSATSVPFGKPITLTATVTPTSGAPNNTPTGKVTFFDGATPLGTVAVDANGTAKLTVTNLTRGLQPLTASYSGDVNFTTSTSAATLVRVFVPETIGDFDSATGTWYLSSHLGMGTPDVGQFQFGGKGWFGLIGDWTGSGQETIAVVDPRTETWYIRNSNTAGAPDFTPFQFGAPGWIPLAGDWTGTGHTGIGVFDPKTGTFYLRNEVSGGGADAGVFKFGAPGWVPVTGDWSGSGRTGIGVVDPTTETWYLRNTATAGGTDYTPFRFGGNGWKPVVGDWNGDGKVTVGVLDPSGNWYIRNSNSGGGVDMAPFAYGMGGWTPLAGNFQSLQAMHLQAPDEGPGAAPVDEASLEATVQAALTRLTEAGVSSAVVQRLASAHYELAALPAGTLGLAFAGSDQVFISRDAAGHGWFVDPTPLQDEEFSAGGVARPGSAAAGHEDLLTTVLHEMAHLVGVGDDSGSALMQDMLAPGVRHTEALDAVFAGR